MSNNTRRFKLEYTDSNGDTQIIAELGQNTGELVLDRFAHYRKAKDPDILKCWLEGQNYGESIPTRKSEYGQAENNTDEPEILLKQYNPDNDSFDTKNRFYAKNKGSINEDGDWAWKLYSFMQYVASERVDVDSVSDTNNNGVVDVEDAMNAVLPDGYVADVPASVTPPEIGDYAVDARREKALQELTRDYNWTLTFTGNLDANNDYKVKYEPEGFGGTVDTLVSNEQSSSHRIEDVDTSNNIYRVSGDKTDVLVVNQSIEVVRSTGNDGTYTIQNLSYDSNDNQTDITVDENVTDSTADGIILPGSQAKLKNWEKEKTSSIINKVQVVGTEKDNPSNQIKETVTNSFMLNEFAEKYKQIKVGYLNSTAHAQRIAQSYLVPGKNDDGTDIEQVPESGTVKTTAYSDNVINDSFQVVDNTRNISDTYTCVQQRNYWPEGATEIEFEFEQENLEKAARDSENLRDERARLYPSSQTDVGNQGVETGDALSNTSKTGGVGKDDDRDNDFSNVAKLGGVGDLNDRKDNLSNVAKTGGVNTAGGSTEIAATDSTFTNKNAPEGNFVNLASFTGNNTATEGATVYVGVDVKYNDNIVTNNGDFLNTDIDITVSSSDSGDIPSNYVGTRAIFTFIDTNGDGATDVNTRDSIAIAITIPENTYNSDQENGKTYDVNIRSNDLDVVFSGTVTFVEYDEHDHPDNIATDNNDMGLTDDIGTDNNKMGLTDDVATEDNNHGGGSGDDQHGGDTDPKNIDVSVEDKTDR